MIGNYFIFYHRALGFLGVIKGAFSVVIHGQLQSLNSSFLGSFTRFLTPLDKLLDSLTCDQWVFRENVTISFDVIGIKASTELSTSALSRSLPIISELLEPILGIYIIVEDVNEALNQKDDYIDAFSRNIDVVKDDLLFGHGEQLGVMELLQTFDNELRAAFLKYITS